MSTPVTTMVEDGSTRKRRDREPEPATTTGRLHGLRTYFDAAALLTIATVILYFWGFIYVKSYFDSAGVSPSHFDMPTEFYLLATWSELLLTGLKILSIYVVVSVFRWMLSDEEIVESAIASIRKKFPRLPQRFASFCRKVGPSIAVTTVVVLVLLFALSQERRGYRDGRSMLEARFPVTVVTKSDVGLPSPLFYFACGGDKYVFFSEDPDTGARRMILLPQDDIAKLEFAGR